MTDFSAGASTLGSLHQVRYALVLLLENEDTVLRLEALDDIDLTQEEQPSRLFQIKHRASGTLITNSDPDLWKTLRVWATAVKDQRIDPTRATFSLITTANAGKNSAIEKLRPDAKRSTKKAHDTLVKVAKTSKNKSLSAAFSAFLDLQESTRRALVDRIYVLDGSRDIEDSRHQLERRLGPTVRPEHRSPLADRIEGWWFGVSIHLLRKSRGTISGFEAIEKVSELAAAFRPSALPLDFLSVVPTTSERVGLLRRQFIDQVRVLGANPGRLENALIDYYRAFSQRSRWTADHLLVGSELTEYENLLRDEWDRMRLYLLDAHGDLSTESAMQDLGRKLLGWMEVTADFPIRADVHHAYIMRGTYHILADDQPPRVWWHPQFIERLTQVPEEKEG